MPFFSQKSLERLETCHPQLQGLFKEVIRHYDCTILEGHRSREAQLKAFNEGKSEAKPGFSKHNSLPALAVDVAPYPVRWPDNFKPGTQEYVRELCRWYNFGGFVLGIAKASGIKVRWGGDWDQDWDLFDQTLYDLPHFELL